MTDPENEELGSALFVFALESGRADEAVEAVLRLGKLEQLTGWPQLILRKRLGCRFTKHLESVADRAQGDEAVKHSRDYLDWVAELADLVTLKRDCRDVVRGAYELCAGAGVDMGERVACCRAAVERSPGGGMLSPREYIKLGEIAQAWHVAALQLELGPAKEEAELAERLLKSLEHRPHVASERLAQLAELDASTRFGERVYAAIIEHCEECETCREAAGPGVLGAPVVRAIRATLRLVA